VKFLRNFILDDLREKLSKLVDLERLISRINAKNCRLQELMKALKSLEQAQDIGNFFKKNVEKRWSKVGKLMTMAKIFPDVMADLSDWQKRFDMELAEKEGKIVPFPGSEKDFDELQEKVKGLEQELEKYRKSQATKFQTKDLKYWHKGKFLYQLEVPVENCKNVGSDYVMITQTKVRMTWQK
jgi:DNA mismatch repair protein MSH6